MGLSLIVFLPCLHLPITAQSNAAAGLLRIGVIQNSDDFDGAGCKLQTPSDYQKGNGRSVFMSDYEGGAVMNIEGRDVRLRFASYDERLANAARAWILGLDSSTEEVRKGLRSVLQYRAPEVEVRVDYVVTKVCKPNDESCEVTWFDAKITVTKASSKRTVDTKGICGA